MWGSHLVAVKPERMHQVRCDRLRRENATRDGLNELFDVSNGGGSNDHCIGCRVWVYGSVSQGEHVRHGACQILDHKIERQDLRRAAGSESAAFLQHHCGNAKRGSNLEVKRALQRLEVGARLGRSNTGAYFLPTHKG